MVVTSTVTSIELAREGRRVRSGKGGGVGVDIASFFGEGAGGRWGVGIGVVVEGARGEKPPPYTGADPSRLDLIQAGAS